MAEDVVEEFNDNPDWTEVGLTPLDISGMLLAARSMIGLTNAGMAELLGVSLETLDAWEERRAEPDAAARTLIRLVFKHPQEMAAMLRELDA